MSDPNVPKRSLPSYREPTPETHRRISRETEAELALKNTVFAPGTDTLLAVFLLFTICAVPLLQLIAELRITGSVRKIPTLLAFESLVPDLANVHSVSDLWRTLPKPEQTKSVQKALESDSVVSRWLLPRVDSVLTGILGAGNEQVYLGRNGWLFYRPDVDYVVGPGFLDPFWTKRRRSVAAVNPDATGAILHFRDQLRERGIDLLVLPVPVKSTVESNMLSKQASEQPIDNASFGAFKEALRREGVRVLDPKELIDRRPGQPVYLRSDTHWRPETMLVIAQKLAGEIGRSETASPFQTGETRIEAIGDIGRMLKLPPYLLARYKEEITVRPVTAGNTAWRPRVDSDVLLLGDSFANIFSLDSLGWGESAGFAEQLSNALRRPIDCILQNNDGAFATRQVLSRELARGRDRLAGKKVVVWEFAARELAFGNWKRLDLRVQAPPRAHFFVPQPGQKVKMIGLVESTSTVPLPGSVPYFDHIMALHLVDVLGTVSDRQNVECLVYLWSMRDNAWTQAAHLRPGDRISLTVQPWTDVSAQLDKINRSEIDDPRVQLEEPCWGELSH